MPSSKETRPDGISPELWGTPLWLSLHFITFSYPTSNPSEKTKREYKQFFKSVGNVLPCSYCRKSFKQFLKEMPLTSRVLSSRKNLVNWLFNFHNKVNVKLQKKPMSKRQFEQKYFRLVSIKCSKQKCKVKTSLNGRKI